MKSFLKEVKQWVNERMPINNLKFSIQMDTVTFLLEVWAYAVLWNFLNGYYHPYVRFEFLIWCCVTASETWCYRVGWIPEATKWGGNEGKFVGRRKAIWVLQSLEDCCWQSRSFVLDCIHRQGLWWVELLFSFFLLYVLEQMVL